MGGVSFFFLPCLQQVRSVHLKMSLFCSSLFLSQTPARKLENYASTGHANSPAAILLGRAHSKKIVQPTGAAPRLITNTAVLKKDMKMDEDLTGKWPFISLCTKTNDKRCSGILH